MIFYDFAEETDKETLLRPAARRRARCRTTGRCATASNNWGFDAAEQSDLTYTGMGLDINVHDQWAVESMGRIQDRTVERLGVSDRAVTANRRLLLRAIDAFEAGRATPGRPIDDARPPAR